MKNTSKILIGAISVFAILLTVAAHTGQLEKIETNVKLNKDVNSNAAWRSEPYGDAGIMATVTCSTEKLGDDYYVFKYIRSVDGTIDRYDEPFMFPLNDLRNLDYPDVCQRVDHKSKAGIQSSTYVPMNCEYIVVGGKKYVPVEGTIATPDGSLTFKLCFITYNNDEEFYNMVLYDNNGKAHKYVRR